jgi:plastocyanin
MKIILVAAMLLLVCLISLTQSKVSAQSEQVTITIHPGATDSGSQNPIEPANVTVPIGATVIWENKDSVYHQIVSGTPNNGPSNIFYGDFFAPNESYNVTFDTPGTIDYYDPIWTNIKGQVITIEPNNVTTTTNSNNSINDTGVGALNANPPITTQSGINNGFDSDNLAQTQQTEIGIIGEKPPQQIPEPELQQPVQQQPLQPAQQQLIIPQHGDIDSFKATGKIHTIIVTGTSTWNATGDWTMIVEDGEMKNFVTNMAWFNGTSGHTHDFINFDPDGDITLPSNNMITINGDMDVASNGVVTWEGVDTTINIGGGGRTITIDVDHEDTDHHFAGQPILGTVTSLTPCSDTPGPNMEIFPSCN